eukprot:3126133-Prymnesium_polylepis.1
MVVCELLPHLPHDASRNAVFQAKLSWGDLAKQKLSLVTGAFGEGISVRIQERLAEHIITNCELTLDATRSIEGAVEGSIEFNTDLFERGSIERLAA